MRSGLATCVVIFSDGELEVCLPSLSSLTSRSLIELVDDLFAGVWQSGHEICRIAFEDVLVLVFDEDRLNNISL